MSHYISYRKIGNHFQTKRIDISQLKYVQNPKIIDLTMKLLNTFNVLMGRHADEDLLVEKKEKTMAGAPETQFPVKIYAAPSLPLIAISSQHA